MTIAMTRSQVTVTKKKKKRKKKKIIIIIIISEHSKNRDKNLIGTIVASRSRIAKTQSEI